MSAGKREKEAPVAPSGGAQSLRVSIAGESISLISDQPEAVVAKVAGYINDKVREVGGGTHPDKFRILALAAMSVAGELIEAKSRLEENDKATHEMLAQAKSMTETLDRALASQG
ncbi:MAG TPA: hypothetical protein DCQ83_04865 [Fibrobacteres bacterium]|jgi:cell division protein ZapA (FtsZ GTPase activity inhibitor)|nr:hypothetical protein [Fibrobacterota bacterium]